MKRFALSRRAVLRGVGLAPISVALPTLDAMLDGRGWLPDARGQAAPPPLVFLTVFTPNGVYPDAFWPTTAGADYALSRCLMPLADFKADFNVFQNLRKDEAFRGQNINTDAHIRGHASFATGGCITATGVEFASADQIAADKLGNDTKFRSLPVALGGVRAPASNSQNHISWSGPDQPVPADRNPVTLFGKLFGTLPSGAPATGTQPVAVPAKPLADYTKSILDYVRDDVADLQPRLGAADRARLDQHLGAIRDLEKQLAPMAATGGGAPGGSGALPAAACRTAPAAPSPAMNIEPPGIDDSRGGYSNERAQALIQLQVMALACGLTRFGSFMLASRPNKRQFPWLGATDGNDGHHGISHDSTPAGYEKQAKIVTDELTQFAYLLALMKDARQGDRTLLSNAIVFFASEHGHGEAHDFTKVPVIVAGQAGGKITTGRHVVYKPGTKYSNLLVTLLNVLGLPITKFGALGDGPLPDVT